MRSMVLPRFSALVIQSYSAGNNIDAPTKEDGIHLTVQVSGKDLLTYSSLLNTFSNDNTITLATLPQEPGLIIHGKPPQVFDTREVSTTAPLIITLLEQLQTSLTQQRPSRHPVLNKTKAAILNSLQWTLELIKPTV